MAIELCSVVWIEIQNLNRFKTNTVYFVLSVVIQAEIYGGCSATERNVL